MIPSVVESINKIERLPIPLQQEVSDFVSFLLDKYHTRSASPRAGCMKGTFTIKNDDFNAPLDDFKDYQ